MLQRTLRLSFAAAFLLPALNGLSQVTLPGATSPSSAIFAQGSAAALGANADPTEYSNLVYGGSVGGYLQAAPLVGIDTRIFALQSKNQAGHEEHERAAFAGPRLAFRRHRLDFYGSVLGGVSHADYVASPLARYSNGEDVLTATTEPALQVGGGVDFHFTRRLYWRVGDVAYNHMFASGAPSGAVFSTGLVLKTFR